MGLFNRKKKETRSIDYVNPADFNCGIGLKAYVNGVARDTMSLSGVFAAVELIANSIAQLPIYVKTNTDNKRTIVQEHPVYHLFDGGLMTKYTFIKQLVSDMLLHGNGFAYIQRAQDGTPTQLIYCPHGTVTINYNENTRKLLYTCTQLRRGKIEPIDMIHILKNSTDGVNGKGIIAYAASTLKLAKLTESAAMDYFGSGCHVAGILSTDSPRLTKDQRDAIRQSWNDAHGSSAGTGMAVLEAGMKYQPVSSNSKDAQMLESRLYNLQDVARFFNINPVLLGDLSHSSYSTIEASLLEFVIHTLAPYITLMQEEFTRKLIKPSEKGLYIDFDENAILKSDKSSQATYLSTLVSNGIMTPNEARQQLGLNAMEGCDDLVIPYTDLSQNKINQPDKNIQPKKEDEGNE